MRGTIPGRGPAAEAWGVCLIYGPFAINGILSPECNVELEEKLQERNPGWGLRDVEKLRQLATPNALRLERMVRFSVVWETGRFQGLGRSCREPRSC